MLRQFFLRIGRRPRMEHSPPKTLLPQRLDNTFAGAIPSPSGANGHRTPGLFLPSPVDIPVGTGGHHTPGCISMLRSLTFICSSYGGSTASPHICPGHRVPFFLPSPPRLHQDDFLIAMRSAVIGWGTYLGVRSLPRSACRFKGVG